MLILFCFCFVSLVVFKMHPCLAPLHSSTPPPRCLWTQLSSTMPPTPLCPGHFRAGLSVDSSDTTSKRRHRRPRYCCCCCSCSDASPDPAAVAMEMTTPGCRDLDIHGARYYHSQHGNLANSNCTSSLQRYVCRHQCHIHTFQQQRQQQQ